MSFYTTHADRPRCTDREAEPGERGLRFRCASVATHGDKCDFHAETKEG